MVKTFFRFTALTLALVVMPALPRAAIDVSDLSIAELSAVEMVSSHINDIRTMRGTFEQTAPDGQVTQGRFFIERPGKLRFDYAPPSHMTLISDGFWVAVQDRQLETTERYPLRTTPLRILLSDDLDLLEDARILDVNPDVEDGTVSVTLESTSRRVDGSITLFFDPVAGQLDRWTVRDAQGLDTQVDLGEVERGVEIEARYFRIIEDTTLDVGERD